jgi:hypothetical protein
MDTVLTELLAREHVLGYAGRYLAHPSAIRPARVRCTVNDINLTHMRGRCVTRWPEPRSIWLALDVVRLYPACLVLRLPVFSEKGGEAVT